MDTGHIEKEMLKIISKYSNLEFDCFKYFKNGDCNFIIACFVDDEWGTYVDIKNDPIPKLLEKFDGHMNNKNMEIKYGKRKH